MEIKNLAKNTIILAVPKVLLFFVGTIRSKLIAVFLGPEGAGIMSQLRDTVQNISSFTLSGMNDGVVKLIAKENSIDADIRKIASIIKTFGYIIVPLTFIVVIAGYTFSSEITQFVFGNLKYKDYFQIGFMSLPFVILSSSSFAILKAYKEIKLIAISDVVIMVTNLILFVPLIYFFKIKGAVFFVAISYFINLGIYFYFARTRVLSKINLSFFQIANTPPQKAYFKELFRFFGYGLTSGAFQIAVGLTIRSIVVNTLGLAKIGIYSPILTWSGLITGFILSSLTTYLFPRISEAKSNDDIVGVINDVIRLMTFTIFPFIIIGIATRDWFIPMFYSKEFLEAAIYLPFHFSALIFTIWNFAFAQIFAPTGRLRYFFFIIVFHNTLSLLMVYFLTPHYGLFGWMAQFTITPVVTALVYFIFWQKTIHFKLQAKNWKLVLYTILALGAMLVVQNSKFVLLVLSAFAIFFMYFLLDINEKNFLKRKSLNIIKHSVTRRKLKN